MLLHEFFNSPTFRVIYDNGVSQEVLNFQEISKFKHEIVKELRNVSLGVIGVVARQSCILPPILLSILECGFPFYTINSADWIREAQQFHKIFNFSCLTTDFDCEFEAMRKVCVEFEGKRIYLHINESFPSCHQKDRNLELKKVTELKKHRLKHELTLGKKIDNEKFKFSYVMRTSGTTGSPKYVFVSHDSICPNIVDIGFRIWESTPSDIIFGNSPYTFDPSVVDLFIAMATGAGILYMKPEIKDSPLATQVLKRNSVTILSITPSYLLKHELNFSSLKFRVLSLGGEKCLPPSYLRSFKFMKVVNLYGLTEMSCWASANVDVLSSNDDEVSVGEALANTEMIIEDHEIVLESDTRFCVTFDNTGKPILAQNQSKMRLRTGDLCKVLPNGKIIVTSRNDAIVKRNGLKVPLNVIEECAMNSGLLKTSKCVVNDNGEIQLLVIPNGHALQDFNPLIALQYVPPDYFPDSVTITTTICINDNGKIVVPSNAEKPKFTLPGEMKTRVRDLAYILSMLWSVATGRKIPDITNQLMDNENFFEVGGSSASGRWMIEALFQQLGLYGGPLMKKLDLELLSLLYTGCFSDLLKRLESTLIISTKVRTCQAQSYNAPKSSVLVPKSVCKIFPNLSINKTYRKHSKENFLELMNNKFTTKVVYDLRMCVDANVSIVRDGPYKNTALVGSHSGVIIAVNVEQLTRLLANKNREVFKYSEVRWCVMLPGRIEAQISLCSNQLHGFIGCANGYLYKFNISNGEVIAKFPTAGSIRSQVTVSDGFELFFNDSSDVVYSTDQNLKLLWRKRLKSLISTTPLILLEENADQLVLARTSQNIIALDAGRIVWTISSHPTVIPSIVALNQQLVILIMANNKKLEARDGFTSSLLGSCDIEKTPREIVTHTCSDTHNVVLWFETHFVLLNLYLKNDATIEFGWEEYRNAGLGPTFLCGLRQPYCPLVFHEDSSFYGVEFVNDRISTFLLDRIKLKGECFSKLNGGILSNSLPYLCIGGRDDLLKVWIVK